MSTKKLFARETFFLPELMGGKEGKVEVREDKHGAKARIIKTLCQGLSLKHPGANCLKSGLILFVLSVNICWSSWYLKEMLALCLHPNRLMSQIPEGLVWADGEKCKGNVLIYS